MLRKLLICCGLLPSSLIVCLCRSCYASSDATPFPGFDLPFPRRGMKLIKSHWALWPKLREFHPNMACTLQTFQLAKENISPVYRPFSLSLAGAKQQFFPYWLSKDKIDSYDSCTGTAVQMEQNNKGWLNWNTRTKIHESTGKWLYPFRGHTLLLRLACMILGSEKYAGKGTHF